MRLLKEIRAAFHSLPVEIWTVDGRLNDLRSVQFWRDQQQAILFASHAALESWKSNGVWPSIDERTAYFLRVELEYIAKLLMSDEGKFIPKDYADPEGEEVAYRKAVVRTLSEHWSSDQQHIWAVECARYGSPRRVFLRDGV